MAIKFGFNQFKAPAPVLYKRFVNMMIMFIVPATASMIIAMPVSWMTDIVKVWIGLASTYTIAILKGLEYFLGINEEIEPPK